MGDTLLWSLLTGDVPVSPTESEENLLQKIYMGGYSVAVLALARLRDGVDADVPAEKVSGALEEAVGEFQDEQCRGVGLYDGRRLCYVLMSYQSHRDFESGQLALRAIQESLKAELGIPVSLGVGGFCAYYEMIPFSCREAKADAEKPGISKSVRNILRYAEENYQDTELSNGAIAKASYLNYSYMCSQFHLEMGITVNHYIRQYRMRQALSALDEGAVTVQETALRVGYDDCKYFSKSFKKEIGMTPLQYLRRKLEA